MVSKVTNHKLISLYVAYARGSKIYRETLQLVKKAYPDNKPFYQASIAMALFHAGRCCHYQGYYRDELASRQGVGPNHRAYVEAPAYQEQRILNIQKYVKSFNPSTIECWLPVFREMSEYLYQGEINWFKAQATRKVNEQKVKEFKARMALS